MPRLVSLPNHTPIFPIAQSNPVEENWGTSSTIDKFIRKSRVGGLKMTSKTSSPPAYRRREVILKSFIFVLLMKIREVGVLYYNLALYLAMIENPPFPIAQAWIKWDQMRSRLINCKV